MKTRHIVLASLLTLVLAACGTPPQTPEPEESPLSPSIPLSPLSTPPANPVAAAAVAYLAAELDLSPREVTVLSSESVQWSDTSLGCPQPGMMYAQVVTPGYRFRLEAAGEQYDVHTDKTADSIIICRPTSEKTHD